MSSSTPPPDAAVYVISVAAELTGLHPQTLRSYERLGLIRPGRTGGGGRRYSHSDIALLRTIADLTAAGIGIEGVRRILDLETRVQALTLRNAELQAELEGTREALAQAMARSGHRRERPLGQPVPGAGSESAGNTLPVLRSPGGSSQAIVVWRRSPR